MSNPGFTRAAVHSWRRSLEAQGLAPSTINVRLAAVRKLAREAALTGALDSEAAASVQAISGVRERGSRAGCWLTREQAEQLYANSAYSGSATPIAAKRSRASRSVGSVGSLSAF